MHKNATYWRVLTAYRAAAPLEHQRHGTPHAPGYWDSNLNRPDGVTVSVKALDVLSNVAVKYSDEGQKREVYHYQDYIFPIDIRVSGNVMYVLVSGLAGGMTNETRLIVFDLATRKTLHDLRIDHNDL